MVAILTPIVLMVVGIPGHTQFLKKHMAIQKRGSHVQWIWEDWCFHTKKQKMAIHETHQSFKGGKNTWSSGKCFYGLMKHTNHKGGKKTHDQMESVFMAIHETHQSQRGKKTHDQMESVFMAIHETHQSQRGKKKHDQMERNDSCFFQTRKIGDSKSSQVPGPDTQRHQELSHPLAHRFGGTKWANSVWEETLFGTN